MAELVTLSEVAALYGFHVDSVRKMAQRGRLPGAFKAGAAWRVNLDKLRKEWSADGKAAHA